MNNDELITVIAASFLGAIVSGLTGWWDSHESWDTRKFMGTVWRAIFSAMSFGFANQFVEIRGAIWLYAFLGGAGVDVLGNRLQGGAKGKDPAEARLAEIESKIGALAKEQKGTSEARK